MNQHSLNAAAKSAHSPACDTPAPLPEIERELITLRSRLNDLQVKLDHLTSALNPVSHRAPRADSPAGDGVNPVPAGYPGSPVGIELRTLSGAAVKMSEMVDYITSTLAC